MHIALIIDGNGRWAESRGMPRSFGHHQGIHRVKEMISVAQDLSIQYLSLYVFSQDNWNRPAQEISFLFDMMFRSLEAWIPFLQEKSISIRVIGERQGLTRNLQENIRFIEESTQEGEKLKIQMAFNYSGQWDILQAIQSYTQNHTPGSPIFEPHFQRYLSTYPFPEPHLLIRTGGEKRLSNFFLWQLAYTELLFSDLYWPDFSIEELKKAIAWYHTKEKRFGSIYASELSDGAL